MRIPSLLSILIILILLTIIALLYLRLKRFHLAMDKIVTFVNSFLSGNVRRISLEEDRFGTVSSALNAMVSDIKSRIKEMTEERNKLQAILKCMNYGILITDTKARIVLANPAIKALLGIKTDIVGEPMIVAIRNTEIYNLVMRVIETGEEHSEEIDISYPDKLYLMASAVPLYPYEGQERISGVVLSIHDITKIKKLEDMRKNFVANVSHEIKTPITAIKGFTETLLEGAIDERENARKFLEIIKSHSERINKLVEDLLILSRIELGDMRIEKVNVDVSKVIDTVFTTLEDRAQVKGLYLKKSFPSELSVYADRDRLVQILLNLVDNGIKFTEHGGVTVGVEEADGQTLLFVEDTGIGIAKEHWSRLGTRFYRVDSSRSRELGGTGLGLAIVKHFVKTHGWEMEVESTSGKGTKVKLLIPDVKA